MCIWRDSLRQRKEPTKIIAENRIHRGLGIVPTARIENFIIQVISVRVLKSSLPK